MAKVRNPRAVAAAIGRKKYGSKRFAKMGAQGRRRAAAAGAKTEAPGGGKRFARMTARLSKRG